MWLTQSQNTYKKKSNAYFILIGVTFGSNQISSSKAGFVAVLVAILSGIGRPFDPDAML